MKKLFSILALAMVISLFSSCIIVATEDKPDPTYSFYFFNNTDYEVRDWYLLDRKNNMYTKYDDNYACEIRSREISSISGLHERDYRVFYEYYDGIGRKHQEYTDYFELKSHTTYKLYENSFYEGKPRSAE